MRGRSPERHELEPIEIASRDEITVVQLARLKATLRHVYERVPHYRAAFDRAGVHPDDLRELADLARFPFTTKEDLRRHYPFGMFAVPRADVVRIRASSGTTGRPDLRLRRADRPWSKPPNLRSSRRLPRFWRISSAASNAVSASVSSPCTCSHRAHAATTSPTATSTSRWCWIRKCRGRST